MKINQNLFRDLLNKTKHCVAKNAVRPALQYVQVAVSENEICLSACDGYRVVVNKAAIKSDEKFVCLILPLTIKADKTDALEVELTCDEKTAQLTLLTEEGYQTLCFKQPVEEFPNLSRLIPTRDDIAIAKIAFKGDVLLSALSPFGSKDDILKCYVGKITDPLCIESESKNITTQLFVYPWLSKDL